ncbi:hypothetical protein BS47DRAFT_1358130 [Hydnum rufescens UP504]|uniref:Alpha/beta hydrolase fold-3 domain-containing protein n=1 Tax=Hydnum rufescens UP504 TaxID=1448309 RepID=A0A9P6B8R9_9AGAM|nr:hypothetical protein BS47DRAFT_1358130 [Hydnum rufescens UP504]
MVRSVRVMVPLSSCRLAAEHLINALGGEEQASRVTGGTRWWQVRGLNGVDASWIVMKKDLESAKKERLRRESVVSADPKPPGNDKGGEFFSDLDSMRCLYHIHAGGYFFGSVDQERFSMQRYAGNMNGRVFAINYRLAPQYPFPCALQDALAGYMYLIRPPPEASHAAVNPSQIIVGGVSAGGGIALALLQVIRDSGLPLPAAAILPSPWGDLTHSFPSVLQNRDTDTIPPYGLNLYRPSPLWPPPSDEMDTSAKNVLTSPVRASVEPEDIPILSALSSSVATSPKTDGVREPTFRRSLGGTALTLSSHQETPEVASKILKPTTSQSPTPDQVPSLPKDLKNQVHSELPSQRRQPLVTEVDGQKVEIKSQIHLYAMNHQLGHPLVSPVLGYLGGLPPLYIMCGDTEVLRDEIIYMAHKAAHPEHYPVKENTKSLYPALIGIEQRYGATDVHLQVYDGQFHRNLPVVCKLTERVLLNSDACHALPLLLFSTRVAAFCKHFVKAAFILDSPQLPDPEWPHDETQSSSSANDGGAIVPGYEDPIQGSGDRHPNSYPRDPILSRSREEDHRDDVHPGIHHSEDPKSDSALGMAGYPGVYQNVSVCHNAVPGFINTQSPFVDHMIRERVSTRGFSVLWNPKRISLVASFLWRNSASLTKKASVKRYLEGQALWDQKFSRQVEKVARQREKKNFEPAGKREHVKMMVGRLQDKLERKFRSSTAAAATTDTPPDPDENENATTTENNDANVFLNSPQWDWSWALEGEDPPPSSIVARRDTAEARRLSKSADMRLKDGDSRVSGNHLWALVVDRLSAAKSPSPPVERERTPQESDDPESSRLRLSAALSSVGKRLPTSSAVFKRFKHKGSQSRGRDDDSGST